MERVKNIILILILQVLNIQGLQMVTLRDTNQQKISQNYVMIRILYVNVVKRINIDRDYGDTKINVQIQIMTTTFY